ncbi:MAG: hypothetical protein IKB99_00915 [Lentisphaeria bacterium]|nr:hypothetical protein [Lentisphaeria bacterium]
MKHIVLTFLVLTAVVLCGCHAVYPASEKLSPSDLAREGEVVFTRPTNFWPLFGSRSIDEYVEITYAKSHVNKAGQLVVEVGIRNCGPTSWTNWWKSAPARIDLQTRCNFFKSKLGDPIIYETNVRNIFIGRGQTYAYKAVCPNTEARSFQLVLGGFNE